MVKKHITGIRDELSYDERQGYRVERVVTKSDCLQPSTVTLPLLSLQVQGEL